MPIHTIQTVAAGTASGNSSMETEYPPIGTPDTSCHREFEFDYNGIPYYGCTAYLYKDNSLLEVTAVASAAALKQQIYRQRGLFFLINLSASHELRTPLAAMLSCACAGQKAESEQKDGFLATIQSEGTRMSRLIDDMLTLAKTDNHAFAIEKAPWEPDTLLLNAFEAFEPMAKQKNLSFTVVLPEEASSPCLLDRERIMQVRPYWYIMP